MVSQLFSSLVPSSAAYHNLAEEVRGPGMQSKKGSRFARQWSSCGVGTGGSLYAASTRAFSTSRKERQNLLTCLLHMPGQCTNTNCRLHLTNVGFPLQSVGTRYLLMMR